MSSVKTLCCKHRTTKYCTVHLMGFEMKVGTALIHRAREPHTRVTRIKGTVAWAYVAMPTATVAPPNGDQGEGRIPAAWRYNDSHSPSKRRRKIDILQRRENHAYLAVRLLTQPQVLITRAWWGVTEQTNTIHPSPNTAPELGRLWPAPTSQTSVPPKRRPRTHGTRGTRGA